MLPEFFPFVFLAPRVLNLSCRCRIEFLPHWISTHGSWFNGQCSGFNGFFMLNCDPETGGHCITNPPTDTFWPRWIVTPGHNSTLKCDPGSCFHVELWPGSRFHVEIWPQVMVPRWIVCDLGSWFHVELWPQDWISRWIVTLNHDSTLN